MKSQYWLFIAPSGIDSFLLNRQIKCEINKQLKSVLFKTQKRLYYDVHYYLPKMEQKILDRVDISPIN